MTSSEPLLNFYQILRINPRATQEEVNSACTTLSEIVTQAKQVLMDPSKRREYDRRLIREGGGSVPSARSQTKKIKIEEGTTAEKPSKATSEKKESTAARPRTRASSRGSSGQDSTATPPDDTRQGLKEFLEEQRHQKETEEEQKKALFSQIEKNATANTKRRLVRRNSPEAKATKPETSKLSIPRAESIESMLNFAFSPVKEGPARTSSIASDAEKQCQRCKGRVFVEDEDTADIICKQCGNVVGQLFQTRDEDEDQEPTMFDYACGNPEKCGIRFGFDVDEDRDHFVCFKKKD